MTDSVSKIHKIITFWSESPSWFINSLLILRLFLFLLPLRNPTTACWSSQSGLTFRSFPHWSNPLFLFCSSRDWFSFSVFQRWRRPSSLNYRTWLTLEIIEIPLPVFLLKGRKSRGGTKPSSTENGWQTFSHVSAPICIHFVQCKRFFLFFRGFLPLSQEINDFCVGPKSSYI